MVMPAHIQPGELAAHMSFSAPISLGLFLIFVYVITLLRRIEIHPINFLLVAGLAQLLYQVGFSTAHFFEGYTGLSITVLVILTLFLLMQLTGRVSWSAVFSRRVTT